MRSGYTLVWRGEGILASILVYQGKIDFFFFLKKKVTLSIGLELEFVGFKSEHTGKVRSYDCKEGHSLGMRAVVINKENFIFFISLQSFLKPPHIFGK